MHGRDPLRVVDDPNGVEPSLADHVRAASEPPARLNPYAVDRIERRLDALGPDGSSSVWRAFRLPAYAMGCALAAVVVWEQTSPQDHPRGLATKNVAAVESVPLPMPLRLTTGSLELRTDGDAAVVETPTARVEIEPHSNVRITVVTGQRDVRIAAMAGSAHVVYFDELTELTPPATVAPTSAPVPKHHARTKSIAPVVQAEAVAAPVVDEESASLEAALSRMRTAPEDAVALLDAHLARYGSGVTLERAERSRIALLLRLMRQPEALAGLDGMKALTPDLQVLRGELRWEAKRFDEASGDFGAVLVSGDERFADRALFGRAMCFDARGDMAHMAEDLQRYLLLHPRGELADKARAALARDRSH